MCLAIPMEVVSVSGNRGLVAAGGVSYEVSFRLLSDIAPGDYVIVHAGFAIQRLDVEDAAETLKLFREMGDTPEGAARP